MLAPRVDPVGLVEHPAGFVAAPRPRPLRRRIAAAVVLLAFLSVSVVTTALSAGRYCLTSEATSPSPLHAR